MAAGILLAVVVSVTSAITAGQQNAYEAHQRIAASLAAEELMSRLTAEPYVDLPKWHGYAEAVGEMRDAQGNLLPGSLSMIGREVQVTTTLKTVPGPEVRIRGRDVRVRAFNEQGRILADFSRFTPEPQS